MLNFCDFIQVYVFTTNQWYLYNIAYDMENYICKLGPWMGLEVNN